MPWRLWWRSLNVKLKANQCFKHRVRYVGAVGIKPDDFRSWSVSHPTIDQGVSAFDGRVVVVALLCGFLEDFVHRSPRANVTHELGPAILTCNGMSPLHTVDLKYFSRTCVVARRDVSQVGTSTFHASAALESSCKLQRHGMRATSPQEFHQNSIGFVTQLPVNLYDTLVDFTFSLAVKAFNCS